MSKLFETPRLEIRSLTPDDASFILALFNAENWLRFLGDRNIKTLDSARNYLESIYIRSYADNGHGAWLVTKKDTGESIGLCGLFKRPYLDLPDLGYSFLPAFEGHGYAIEAASATLHYCQCHLQKTELTAIVSENNVRSVRLLEKLGFVFTEKVTPPGEDRMLLLFRWSAPEQ
jgi:RimJ/RimL family protein N-acetyltransferase